MLIRNSKPKTEKQLQAAANRRAKAAETRRLKNEARQAAWEQKVAESRTEILEAITNAKRKSLFVEGLETLKGDLFNNFRYQWNTYGKLTEKQIDVIVSSLQREKEIDNIYEIFEDYQPGQVYDVELKLEKFQPDHVTTYPNGDQVCHTRFVFKSSERQMFYLSTNNKKLIERLSTHLEVDPEVTLKLRVKHICADKSRVIIDPRLAPKIV
jgi:hypothetical protein